ncbi:MAG: hypothetical protein AAF191_15730, partial [Verrucomicrobiota bacterium]
GDFSAWSETILAPRLEGLQCALATDGRCLLKGAPFPGVAGTPLFRAGRLWLPAGYALPDFLWPELVEEALSVPGGATALVHPDGEGELIPEEAWVAVTRATVRVNQGLGRGDREGARG